MSLCISTSLTFSLLCACALAPPELEWCGSGSAWPEQVRVGILGAPNHFQWSLLQTVDPELQHIRGSSVPGGMCPLGWVVYALPVSCPGKLQAENAERSPNPSPFPAFLRWKQQLETNNIERGFFVQKRQEKGEEAQEMGSLYWGHRKVAQPATGHSGTDTHPAMVTVSMWQSSGYGASWWNQGNLDLDVLSASHAWDGFAPACWENVVLMPSWSAAAAGMVCSTEQGLCGQVCAPWQPLNSWTFHSLNTMYCN